MSRLQLDPGALSAVLDAAKDPNCQSVRLNGVPAGAAELPQPAAGYLCKKCRYTFPSEQLVAGHGCGQSPGCLSLIRVRSGCRQCEQSFDTAVEFKRHVESVHPTATTTNSSTNTTSCGLVGPVNQLAQLPAAAAAVAAVGTNSNHSNSSYNSNSGSNNITNSNKSSTGSNTGGSDLVAPLSPRLSVEMEDVVNQITALAAQTLKPDPNANIFPLPTQGQS